MRNPSVITLVLICVLCASCDRAGPEPEAVPGPVSFWREYVVVEPSDGRTRVVGDYYFRNTTDDTVAIGVSYPFPVDAYHAIPSKVRAWSLDGEQPAPFGFVNDGNAIRWRMEFEPREERRFRVEYVQATPRGRARYIVMTTRLWGKPIELAEFEFRVPASLGNVELSFEPDRVEMRGDTTFYYMKRSPFMPDRDLEVRW